MSVLVCPSSTKYTVVLGRFEELLGLPIAAELGVTRPVRSHNDHPPLRAPETRLLARAIYDCEGDEDGDLSFKEGDAIEVTDQNAPGDGWWTGKEQSNGSTGIFPADYVKLVPAQPAPTMAQSTPALEPEPELPPSPKPGIAKSPHQVVAVPAPPPAQRLRTGTAFVLPSLRLSVDMAYCNPLARAIYDCEGDEAGDLSFKEGDMIDVTDQEEPGDGWWTGRVQGGGGSGGSGVLGIFPSDYVQLTTPAGRGAPDQSATADAAMPKTDLDDGSAARTGARQEQQVR